MVWVSFAASWLVTSTHWPGIRCKHVQTVDMFGVFTSGAVGLPSNHLFPGVPHRVFLLLFWPTRFGHCSGPPLRQNPHVSRLSVRLFGGSNGAGSRQRRHRHYSSFRVVVAKHPNTTTPDEFTETPSTSQPEASSGAGPTLRLGSGFVRTVTKLLGQQQSLFWFRLNTFSCSPPGRATPPHTAARAPAAWRHQLKKGKRKMEWK